MNTTRTCPECGKPVAPNGLQGLCPECMMKVGLAAQTGEVGPGGTPGAPPRTKPPPTPAEVAALFPQLEILECLGYGGMGAVYKARQPRLDRLVALKILTCDREDATREARFAERFEREARALAKLSHPHIVAMYEFGQVEGLPYFIMEYVDGLNVRQLEQSRRLTPREALQIIPQICEALQFAHDEGIVHRDIKPANILIDRKGRVKIADFGIAKIMGGTPLIVSDAEKLAPKPSEGLTQEQVLGTPHYMAPEQVAHPQAVDHRADIYSLGVVFYEMLTGELPVGKFQPPSRKVQIDVRLDEIVLHALEKEPERRYQQVSQVKSAVETIMTRSRPEADFAPTAEALSLRFGTWSWLQATRWSARLLGLSLLLFVAVMVGLLLFGVGLPPLGLQSAGTLLNYLAIALLVLGFILGWKFEGTAAVLIAAGWALWHCSNGSLRWSMFHIALLVATLYAFCWWATRGQRTLVLVESRNGQTANLSPAAATRPGVTWVTVAGVAVAVMVLLMFLLVIVVPSLQRAPSAGSAFGPELEVSLSSLGADAGDRFLDLDGGQIVRAPGPYSGWSQERKHAWLRQEGIDLMLMGSAFQSWSLLTPVDNETKLTKVPADAWQQGLAAEDGGRQPESAEAIQFVSEGVELLQVRLDGRPTHPDHTFAFQTANGTRGLLKVNGISFSAGDEIVGLKLGFKNFQAATPVGASPREVVAEWLRRVKVGAREAWDLTTRSSDVGWGPSFTGLWEYDRIHPLHQLGGEEQAMVLSNPFSDNSGQRRVFCAVLRKRDGRWLVDRHECVPPSDTRSLMRGFAVNPGTKFDVLAAELVGEWGAACDSTISLAADGTGAQLRVGPGGPDPGVKPESFQWEVSGSTLRRHFADRDEKLEILWMDDQGVQFRSPNESEWDAWFRSPQGDSSAPEGSTPNQWKNSKPLTGDQP